MNDEIEVLKAEAKELGIKGFALMKEETLRKAIQEKRAPSESFTPPEDEPVSELSKGPAALEVAKAPAKKPVARKETVVTFYWRDNKNMSFTVKGQVVGGVQQPGTFYKSDRSVLRLNPDTDLSAMNYLRAHAGNECNGGRDFGEYKLEDFEASEKGTMLDKLMALDTKTLVEMVGGGVAMYRSRGHLIAEILGLKG